MNFTISIQNKVYFSLCFNKKSQEFSLSLRDNNDNIIETYSYWDDNFNTCDDLNVLCNWNNLDFKDNESLIWNSIFSAIATNVDNVNFDSDKKMAYIPFGKNVLSYPINNKIFSYFCINSIKFEINDFIQNPINFLSELISFISNK